MSQTVRTRFLKGTLAALLVAPVLAAGAAWARSPQGVQDNRRSSDPVGCPKVWVNCPDTPGQFGRLTFTANVSGGDTSVTPTFNWTVSAGTITAGQGTSSITVDILNAPGKPYTATVDVGGYERACQTSASCSLFICPAPQSRKVDEYGVIQLGDEKERLNHSFVELQNDPTAQGYLICYGGQRSRAGEARRRCERAREYLVSTRGIEGSRVVTVEGGLREVPTTEFWLVPSGASPPQVTPSFFPKGRGRR